MSLPQMEYNYLILHQSQASPDTLFCMDSIGIKIAFKTLLDKKLLPAI
jgi:hypothetical protein